MEETGQKERMCGATLVARFRARRPNVCSSYCDADLAVLMEEAVSTVNHLIKHVTFSPQMPGLTSHAVCEALAPRLRDRGLYFFDLSTVVRCAMPILADYVGLVGVHRAPVEVANVLAEVYRSIPALVADPYLERWVRAIVAAFQWYGDDSRCEEALSLDPWLQDIPDDTLSALLDVAMDLTDGGVAEPADDDVVARFSLIGWFENALGEQFSDRLIDTLLIEDQRRIYVQIGFLDDAGRLIECEEELYPRCRFDLAWPGEQETRTDRGGRELISFPGVDPFDGVPRFEEYLIRFFRHFSDPVAIESLCDGVAVDATDRQEPFSSDCVQLDLRLKDGTSSVNHWREFLRRSEIFRGTPIQ